MCRVTPGGWASQMWGWTPKMRGVGSAPALGEYDPISELSQWQSTMQKLS